MSLVPNVILIIALGIVGLLLLFCASHLSLRRKVTCLQKDLERVSEDVEGLRRAEEMRLFTELKLLNTDGAQVESGPGLRPGRGYRIPTVSNQAS